MARRFFLTHLYENIMSTHPTKEEAIDAAWRNDESLVTHVREVTEGEISETMRLEYLIGHHGSVSFYKDQYWVNGYSGKTPREAIDAAIRSREK